MHKICNLEYLMKNSIQRIIIILFGLWGIFFQTVSANASYYFNQLTIDKGLSQATVTCILSGSDGMMWIGTRSGLNVYDRHEMRSFFYDKDRKNSLLMEIISILSLKIVQELFGFQQTKVWSDMTGATTLSILQFPAK